MQAQLGPIILGFFAALALLSLLDATIYGGTGFYAENTVNKLLYFLGENRVFITDWLAISTWLSLPIAIVPSAMACSFLLIKNNNEYYLTSLKGMALSVVVVAALTTFLGYIVLQFAFHQETLANPTYFNFVVPLVFLLSGAPFYWFSERLNQKHVLIVLLADSIVSLYLVWSFRYPAPSDFHVPVNFKVILVCICLVYLWAICLRYARGPARIVAICLVVIALNYISATPRFPTQFSSQGRKANFLTVVGWTNLCDTLDKSRKAYLWYNLKEAPGAAFLEMASASHMWRSGGVMNEEFPEMSDEEMRRITSNIHTDGKVNIFLFSQKDDAKDIFVARLHERNLRAVLLERKSLTWGNMPFMVYFFSVQQESHG